ncbi:SPFH domain-containing protein [Nonomuraea sp. NPDC050663]|uniref:SPFH domain-containing protein n=1 Tax=Nonomuraea sp. NPDC050663 TaxID=3364370 RepID=UPI0037AA5DF5
MGLWDSIRGEFIDIIEWLDDSRDTIVWRFPRHDNEIKNGARLVVRESQTAVFVNEGRVADVFPPGTHTLATRNLPILSTLQGWKHGFDSPFKAEVYFVSTRQFTDLKWGTQNPIMVRDPEFGPVRLRAFGSYSARVTDPATFLAELAGTDARFRTEEVEGFLRGQIVSRIAATLAGVPALDLAVRQSELGELLGRTVDEQLADVGVSVPALFIANVTFPPEVEAALDKRASMGVLGDLGRYTQYQTANALGTAGAVSEGVGLGMGIAAAQQMVNRPPALPQEQWFVGRDGQQLGPFTRDALPALTPDTLVWKAGMPQWLPASQVPELGLTPPPLPGA